MELIVKLCFICFWTLTGAAYIALAVNSFKREHYFRFGLYVMFAAEMILAVYTLYD